MQLKQILNIPSAFFYKMLIDPVLYDLERYQGHKVGLNQLQGLSYARKTSGNTDETITITKVVLDRSYHFTSQVGATKTAISYDLKPLNDQSFELTYSEKVATNHFWDLAKEKMKQTLSDSLRKRILKQQWNQIEQSY